MQRVFYSSFSYKILCFSPILFSFICFLLTFLEYVDPDKGTIDFFSELVSTISEVKFSPNGYFFASRDYLNIKLWDIRKESGPYKTIKFHEHLLPSLSELYENDSIFDKFQFSWSGDSLYDFLFFIPFILVKLHSI